MGIDYHKELEKEIIHFLAALDKFQVADAKEKSRLEGVMETHVKLMHAAANEVPTAGMHKETKVLEHSFKAYIENVSEETFAALSHAVSTLREYNR